MKSIGIVVDKDLELGELLKKNLMIVFQDFVNINIYRLNYMKSDFEIKDDAVLVMTREKAIEIFNHVKEREKVVIIERIVTLEAFLKLLKIPSGSNVLVVNDNYSTTIEFTTYLSTILKGINFEPYVQGMNLDEFKIIVTPNEHKHCPKNIETVFDTGHRVLDSATFIKIMSVLKINDMEINSRLLDYFNTIVSANNGINDKFVEIVDKGIMLSALLDNTADGILILDGNQNIKTYNERFKKFLNIKEDIDKLKLIDIIEKYINDEELSTALKFKNELKNGIFIRGDRYFNINKKSIIELGRLNGYLVTVTEITYIRKIEQNLTGKLMQAGQVARYTFEDIYTKSSKLKKIIELAKKVAKNDYSVMIQGESGTGKELFAQAIHNFSNRSKQPFLAINCAAVPEHLLESELFGYAGGSFTGALKEGKKGLFENANNGTIFLDEIGDMPINLQSKLLRVIQEKQISRLGSHEVINIDVRLVAATHKNLALQIENGNFRADLYYRLNVIPLEILSLRERKEDIVDLMKFFIEKEVEIAKDCIKILENYPWKGNVRELQNAAKYIQMMMEDKVEENPNLITIETLPNYIRSYFNKNEEVFIQIDLEKEVLKSVAYLNSIKQSSGRGSIKKYLLEKNILMTESEIRLVLEKLKLDALIEISSKRAGAKLTPKGIGFIGEK